MALPFLDIIKMFNYAMTLIESGSNVARFSVNINRIGEQVEWFLVMTYGSFPKTIYFGPDRQRSIDFFTEWLKAS